MTPLTPPRALALALAALPLHAQTEPQGTIPKITPNIRLPSAAPPPREPKDPPARDITDARLGLTFHLPPGWNLARKDGELSTFRLDARNVSSATQFRAVAQLAFNPYPLSTFAGALLYVSSTPRISPEACAAQATAEPAKPAPATVIAEMPFARGHDEHGNICVEARDEIFTAMHAGSCVRFDLTTNTFCGGDVSGARDMTDKELDNIQSRMESILGTAKFAKK